MIELQGCLQSALRKEVEVGFERVFNGILLRARCFDGHVDHCSSVANLDRNFVASFDILDGFCFDRLCFVGFQYDERFRMFLEVLECSEKLLRARAASVAHEDGTLYKVSVRECAFEEF